MAHVQSNSWSDTPETSAETFLFAADAVIASASRPLAPARGALLGSAIGLGCWALVATLAWIAL